MAEITKPIILDETGKDMAGSLSSLALGQEKQIMATVISSGNAGLIDAHYNYRVLNAKSVADVNALFTQWWHLCWAKAVADNEDKAAARQALLVRWFGTVLDDERVHGVKLPLFSTSTAAIGELTDDSVGLVCTPSTATTAGRDDFAYLPQFWTLEVAMERNDDGTHTINAVEFIDDTAYVRSGEHGLCQVLQKNTWVREWKDSQYHYMKMRCHESAGYHTWPQGTGKNGTVYPYIANPKYAAGLGSDGIITCGTGLAPVNFTSHTAGVTLWRKRGAQYSGVAGNLIKWQLAMIWLKYARKGNSGTIEGCSSYSAQYKAAVAETSVERIIVTKSQGAYFLVGSTVIVGDVGTGTSTDRGVASMRSLVSHKRIKSIEDVVINGTTYSALNIDNGGAKFDTVADKTYVSTMPWYSGRNDDVLGYDGSHDNYTNGKEPGLIQRTEFQIGAYLILSDELWQWETEADGSYSFNCYTCHDQSKVTTNGTISSDYEKQVDLTLVFATDHGDKWTYIEDVAIGADPGVLWPAKVSTAAGSGTGVKAGFYAAPRSSGVRAGWCFCNLYTYGAAGLAARTSNLGPGYSTWSGSVGAPSGISG